MRKLISILSLVLVVASGWVLVTPNTANAAANLSKRCVDERGRGWVVEVQWGLSYPFGSDGYRKVRNDVVRFKPTAPGVTTSDYSITMDDYHNPSFITGKNKEFSPWVWYTVNPKDPLSISGTTRLYVTIGEETDEANGCRYMVFIEPLDITARAVSVKDTYGLDDGNYVEFYYGGYTDAKTYTVTLITPENTTVKSTLDTSSTFTMVPAEKGKTYTMKVKPDNGVESVRTITPTGVWPPQW